jgi:hypothetical protein
MRRFTIVLGGLLLAMGLGGHFGGSQDSLWPLVPAILGTILLVLGLAALRAAWQPNMLRAATLVAAVGFLTTVASLITLLKEILKEPTTLSSAITSLLCGALAIAGLKSLFVARAGGKTETKPPDV